MPNIRVMLWAALAAILFLNYEAWIQDYPASPASASAGSPAGPSSTAAGGNAPAGKLGDAVPQAAAPSAAAPSAAHAATAAAPLGSAPAPVDAESRSSRANSPGPPVHVVTDALDI